MSGGRRRDPYARGWWAGTRDWWRRALRQFLLLPVLVVDGFVVLAGAVVLASLSALGEHVPTRALLASGAGLAEALEAAGCAAAAAALARDVAAMGGASGRLGSRGSRVELAARG